jgi:phosphoesterase RecJ-like protein
MDNFNFDLFYQTIEENRSFIITTHVNPDGDAIGSAMALFHFIASFNKDVHVINCSQTPKYYKFLDTNNVIIYFCEEYENLLAQVDVIIYVDLNDPDRTKKMSLFTLASRATKIIIDHHEANKKFADIEFTDAKASSTGEIIYKLISHKHNSLIDYKIAQCLYSAIITDTQSFHLPCATSEVYRISADLIDKGANPSFIYKQIFESNAPNRIFLLSEVLSQMKLIEKDRIVYFVVTQEMFYRTASNESDIDNFINYGLQIETAEIVMLFVELKDGFKVSFRSLPHIPINNLAKEFGGNGHKNAAGARLINVPIQTMLPKILESAKKYLP